MSEEPVEEQGKTDEEILKNVYDPELKERAREWLQLQQKRSDHWERAHRLGKPDSSVAKEEMQDDSYTISAFEAILGHGITRFETYRRAQELSDKKKELDLLDGYTRLVVGYELMTRLRDGRVVVMGMHPRLGPLLATVGSAEKREKQEDAKKK